VEVFSAKQQISKVFDMLTYYQTREMTVASFQRF
jgi:hypothetical protein